MKIQKHVTRKVQHSEDGVNVAGTVNAAVAANVNEPGSSHTKVSSRQRIVQRNGETEVFEESHSFGDEQHPQANEGETK